MTSRGYGASTAIAVLLALLAAGCTEKGPEERLEDAAERVDDARQSTQAEAEDLADELEALQQEQRDVDSAEHDVAQARKALSQASGRLQEALSRLDDKANDVAIFRSVQRALLDEKILDKAAVAAHVEDRTVTLAGSVGDESGRRRAIEIAKQTPGVRSVEDEIEVQQSARRDERAAPAPSEETRAAEDAAGAS